MKVNRTKDKLQSGEVVYGVISSSPDPLIAEVLGLSGWDYYMLDAEHGAITPAQASNVVRACELVEITPLVRVGSKDPKLILQYLDAGMQGVMMPGLMNVNDIRTLVAAIKYPPQGKRGLGLGRTADYMLGEMAAEEYVEFANQNTLVLPQFEHPELLERLPEMAAVEGVDGFVFGPRDLSLNMGYADGPQHTEVQEVIDQAIRILKEAGVFAGITAGSRDGAEAETNRGSQFILNMLPNLLKRSSQEFLGN